MPPSPSWNMEYDCIRGGDGRRYSVWKGQGPKKQARHGNGALFPENYAPRSGNSSKKWHCPVIGCTRAFKLMRGLGEHFTTEHKGDILHDLRDGHFRRIGNAGSRVPYVAYRSDRPPSPVPLPPPSPPKRPFTANPATATAIATATATAAAPNASPAVYIKQEKFDDQDTRPKEKTVIVLDHESDDHRSIKGEDTDQNRSKGTDFSQETTITPVESEHEENKNIALPRKHEQFLDNHLDGSCVQDQGSDIWAYINSLTPEPIVLPDDACIHKLLKRPLCRELPVSWKARLSKRYWLEMSCSLKIITSIVLYLGGEDRDLKICDGFGCGRVPGLVSVLHDFALGSDTCHGQYAFPRCIMVPDDMLMESEAVMERLGEYQCVNAYYRRAKRVPFPGEIFHRRQELPCTPENCGNNRPFRGSSEAIRRNQSRLRSLSATPSRSPKRKASSPEYEDELPSYRLADPSSPNHPAPWEQFTGFLPLRSSPPRAHHSSELGSDITVAHSTTYLAAQPQKRIKLVDNSGLGRGDFTVLTLANNNDVHFLGSEQGSGRILNCSVSKGKMNVRLIVRGRGQAQEELRFTVSEDSQWVVKEGWECEVTKFEGQMGEAKVHVTGLGVSENSQEWLF